MAKNTTTRKQYEQDAAEVAEMLDFYKGQFGEVHSVTCLNCKRVIAVEVAPVKMDGVVLADKGRTLYTHNDLCLSVRRRLDLNDQGQPMYGYQCVCGNTTIMADVEIGEVEERTIITNKAGEIVGDSGPITAASSPFERAKSQANIASKAQNKKADYETNGTVERYETFKLERVK